MKKIIDFPLKELKKFFLPFKNRWTNLSLYTTIIASSVCALPYIDYRADFERYERGEIREEPKLSDYYSIKWIFKDNSQ